MFWCRDIGLAKRLLGYSVWLLGSGLAASNHDTPKASCQYEWYKPTPTPLWHSEWKIFLCEFWLLRCSTMVARAWPVSVEGDSGLAACCPESNEPTLMFLWHFYPENIPLISFNGSQWDVLLRCSKWLLGAWLIASQWSWDADWSSESNEPAPLSLWHCDPELCSIEKRFNWKDGPFHGPSYTIESQWGNFSTSCPQGCNFYPILRYGLTEPASLFKCGQFHISVKSTLWATRHQIFFAMLSQWGNFGTLLPPRGATFTPFWGMVLQSLPASSSVVIHNFYETLWATTPKFAHAVNGTFWAILPLGQTSYPRSLIKVIAHDSRLGRTFWHLIHGSVTKTVGGVARRNKKKKKKKNNNKYEQ